jgi:hypothetical protein
MFCGTLLWAIRVSFLLSNTALAAITSPAIKGMYASIHTQKTTFQTGNNFKLPEMQ